VGKRNKKAKADPIPPKPGHIEKIVGRIPQDWRYKGKTEKKASLHSRKRLNLAHTTERTVMEAGTKQTMKGRKKVQGLEEKKE